MSAPVRRFEGFGRRTQTLRWGLAIVAVGVLLLVTVPDGIVTAVSWVQVESDRLPWYITRASALLAYIVLTASVVYGLVLSTGALDRFAHRAVSATLHRDLAGVGRALALVHSAVLMLDRAVPYRPLELVVPFIGPYRPLWVAFGQLGLVLLVLIMLSTYARKRLPRGAWARIHRLAFVAWGGATVHAIGAGSDAADPLIANMYVASAGIVIGLTAMRICLALAARWTDTMTR
jgi:sulfoxide reductase heme-binding subunit YedZ